VEFSSPLRLDALYIGKTGSTQIFGGNVMFQGSNNNSTWTDLWAAPANPANASNTTANGGVVLANSNKFTVSQNAAAYRYYRIYGVVSANLLAGVASEFYYDVNTPVYQASLFPRTVCADDEDGDGIPNHLDLDSDSDGCSDAAEAGATTNQTTNYTFSGPFGNNGLDNSLETGTESGIVNYTSSFQPAGVDASLNGCLDTDGDGIRDVLDIDDDNDGVPDLTECPDLASYKVYTYNYTSTSWATSVPVSIAGRKTSTVTLDQRGPYSDLNYNGVAWKLLATGVNPDANSKITVTMEPNSGSGGSNASADAMLITNGTNTYIIDDVNPPSGGFSLVGTWVSQGQGYQSDNFYVAAANYAGKKAVWTFSNLPDPEAVCDTDGDGIMNQLDTDSDGDGCGDATEAGATSNTTSNFTFSGPFGSNGLQNSLETSSESGIVNYNSTYSQLALNAGGSACSDSDGDGVLDITDIDDDNDGVPDAAEGCAPVSLDFRSLTWTAADATMTVTATSNSLSTAGLAWRNQFSNQTYSLPLDITFSYTQTTGEVMFGFAPVGGTVATDNWNSTAYGFFLNNTGTYTRYNTTFGSLTSNTTGRQHRITISSTGFLTLFIDGVSVYTQAGLPVTNYRFYIANNTPKPVTDIRFVLPNAVILCSGDTDGDGTIDALDSDSDGDGCSDAFESGATTNTTPGYTFPGLMVPMAWPTVLKPVRRAGW
jgi:hypothetical protein